MDKEEIMKQTRLKKEKIKIDKKIGAQGLNNIPSSSDMARGSSAPVTSSDYSGRDMLWTKPLPQNTH